MPAIYCICEGNFTHQKPSSKVLDAALIDDDLQLRVKYERDGVPCVITILNRQFLNGGIKIEVDGERVTVGYAGGAKIFAVAELINFLTKHNNFSVGIGTLIDNVFHTISCDGISGESGSLRFAKKKP